MNLAKEPHVGVRANGSVVAQERVEVAPRHRSLTRERAGALDDLGLGRLDAARSRGDLRVAHGRRERAVVARRDEVERRAHERRLHDRVSPERTREVFAPEALEPRPERVVGGRCPLRLEPREPLDGDARPEARAREQELPEKRRPVQLPEGEDAFHARVR